MHMSSGERRAPSVSLVLATGVVGFPLIYVLSLGPVLWLANNGWLGTHAGDWISRLYAPIVWIVNDTDWGGPIVWYLELWI